MVRRDFIFRFSRRVRVLWWLIGVTVVYEVAVLSSQKRRRPREEVVVAVEVSGELRSFDDVFASWEKLLALGTVDVFAACVGVEEADYARERFASFGRSAIVGLRDDAPVALRFFSHDDLTGDAVVRASRDGPSRPSRGWLAQLQGVKSASELRRRFGAETYDLVVRTRFDLEILEVAPPALLLSAAAAAKEIAVPAALAHGGVNDKFAVGDPASMATYARFVDLLGGGGGGGGGAEREEAQSSARRASCPVEEGVFQAELCLRWYLVDHHGLKVTPREDLRVQVRRSDGSVSST